MILIPFSYQCGPTLFAYTVHAIENSYLVWTGAIASMSTYSHFLHTTFSAAGKTCFGSIVVLFAFIIIWCYLHSCLITLSASSLSLSLALSRSFSTRSINRIELYWCPCTGGKKNGSCFKNRSDLTDQWSSPTTKAFSHKHRWHRFHVSPLRIHQAFINS